VFGKDNQNNGKDLLMKFKAELIIAILIVGFILWILMLASPPPGVHP
jgi:hypothetical protein